MVNLYPFRETVSRPNCTLEDAIENIDIGGPAMVRSGAKNWKDVAVLTDASQYQPVIDELKTSGAISQQTKFALAVAAFNRISNYDAAISDYLSSVTFEEEKLSETYVPARAQFAGQSNGIFTKVQDLRYGENPHQQAAFYRDLHPAPGSLAVAQQLTDWQRGRNAMDAKRIGSGLLLQTADNHELSLIDLKVVTHKQPTLEEMEDLLFAWKVAKYVKSNAIVFCKGGMTMGVGAGQMSRLDSARIASIKAGHAGLTLQGTVVASDAFFPFRDGLDVVVDAGATCVIQPGGSMRDNEVIDAANERGVAMVFSGVRHFRH